jgi:hypothetical protein
MPMFSSNGISPAGVDKVPWSRCWRVGKDASISCHWLRSLTNGIDEAVCGRLYHPSKATASQLVLTGSLLEEERGDDIFSLCT